MWKLYQELKAQSAICIIKLEIQIKREAECTTKRPEAFCEELEDRNQASGSKPRTCKLWPAMRHFRRALLDFRGAAGQETGVRNQGLGTSLQCQENRPKLPNLISGLLSFASGRPITCRRRPGVAPLPLDFVRLPRGAERQETGLRNQGSGNSLQCQESRAKLPQLASCFWRIASGRPITLQRHPGMVPLPPDSVRLPRGAERQEIGLRNQGSGNSLQCPKNRPKSPNLISGLLSLASRCSLQYQDSRPELPTLISGLLSLASRCSLRCQETRPKLPNLASSGSIALKLLASWCSKILALTTSFALLLSSMPLNFNACATQVESHKHTNEYSGERDDPDYCLICDLATKIANLPNAEDINIENVAMVTSQLQAIDQIKFNFENFYTDSSSESLKGSELDDKYEELIKITDNWQEGTPCEGLPAKYFAARKVLDNMNEGINAGREVGVRCAETFKAFEGFENAPAEFTPLGRANFRKEFYDESGTFGSFEEGSEEAAAFLKDAKITLSVQRIDDETHNEPYILINDKAALAVKGLDGASTDGNAVDARDTATFSPIILDMYGMDLSQKTSSEGPSNAFWEAEPTSYNCPNYNSFETSFLLPPGKYKVEEINRQKPIRLGDHDFFTAKTTYNCGDNFTQDEPIIVEIKPGEETFLTATNYRKPTIAITEPNVDNEEILILDEAGTGTITATVTNAKEGYKVKWQSANTSVAKVYPAEHSLKNDTTSVSASVTAEGAGETTITATVCDAQGTAIKDDRGQDIKATCTVRVRYAPTKADFEFTPPSPPLGATELTWDGGEKSGTVSRKDNAGGVFNDYIDELRKKFTVSYYKDDDSSPTTPSDAGTYTVKVSTQETAHFSQINDLEVDKFTINPLDLTNTTVTLTSDEATYNGQEITKPEVSVKVLNGPFLNDTYHYTVTWPQNMRNADKYTVTVTGKGNCTGTATTEFTINPATPSYTVGTTNLTATFGDTLADVLTSNTMSDLKALLGEPKNKEHGTVIVNGT